MMVGNVSIYPRNRFVEVKRVVAEEDTQKPIAKLARPTLEDGSALDGANNRMDTAQAIKLDASESTDNKGVVKYTFKKNVSGTKGEENYVDIDGCVEIDTPVCIMTPDNTSEFGTANWSRTYFKVEVFDDAGNSDLLSGYRFVEVKK